MMRVKIPEDYPYPKLKAKIERVANGREWKLCGPTEEKVDGITLLVYGVQMRKAVSAREEEEDVQKEILEELGDKMPAAMHRSYGAMKKEGPTLPKVELPPLSGCLGGPAERLPTQIALLRALLGADKM